MSSDPPRDLDACIGFAPVLSFPHFRPEGGQDPSRNMLLNFSPFAACLPLASIPLMSPVLILVLCLIAGIATVFTLPGHREMTLRKLGGVVLIAVGLILAASIVGSAGSGAIYFWVFSAIALGSAVRVVTHSKPVYSALYFVLTVFASAGLFILLEAEFMAAALVLIYAGAILVTYVFVIMLASQATGDGTHMTQMAAYDSHSREPAAAAAVGFALMGVLLFVIFDRGDRLVAPSGPVALLPLADGTPPEAAISVTGGTQELGMYLFRHQLLQLELSGIILLVSMVGAIIISRRKLLMTPSTLAEVEKAEAIAGPATPIDDNPHSIPVYGTESRRVKVLQ
jgi:NADH-quinone oxidoreductase subunit J